MKYHQLVSTPSEVSNWLEEQLEARGIDAVVYARYILSLLYRDSIDIIYPTQDLHITHRNIEVNIYYLFLFLNLTKIQFYSL